jgi:hypothetical protein
MYRNRNTQCLKKCVSYKLHKIIVHMFTILHVSLQFYQHDMYNSTLVLLLFSTFYTFYFLHMYVVCVCVHTHTHPLCRVSSQYTSTTYYTHTLYYTRIGSLHVMYVELLHYVHCRSCRIQWCSRGIFSINFFPLLLLTALKEFQHQFRWAAQWSKFFPWLLTCDTLYRDASISFLNSNKRCS